MVVGDDGVPRGMVNLPELQGDATRLMYALCAVAGDDAAVDRVSVEWLESVDEDEMGYLSAAALSLTVRCVVAPLLEVIETAMPEIGIRRKLAESRDQAEQELGGGR
ncbi:hypothetical protein [Nocardia abscessus]|uniref:hypothetical protein n=1 Tax=Nocardia abscessus TaxID=120957 RepID=UPI0024566873|nr:hypothetical protein [Nocardia abscessus]